MARSSIQPLLALICLATLLYSTTCSTNITDYFSLLAFKNAIAHDPFGALNSWNQTTHFCSWKGIRCSRRHPFRVVGIELMSQGLIGSLSPSIGNMSFLRVLDLHNNSFQDVIPSEIGRLRRLRFLKFSNNSFSGAIPRNMSQCWNLVYLNLIDNHLSGGIRPEFGLLIKIKYLGLAKANLSGSIPPSIGNLTSLVQLSISRCNLIGEIPESLGQLRNLKYTGLGENRFTGRIPYALFNISSMLTFSVRHNQLEGSIPTSIMLTLPNLIGLNIVGNQFSGPVPTSLSNASSIEIFSIGRNNFTGQMPILRKLSHLRMLGIYENPIQDDISFISSLENCTNLEYLEIGDNPISGALPNSIANLTTGLQGLVIQNTHIHGNIPSSIGNLVGLTALSLSSNNLEGAIPQTIGKLHNLIELYLGDNKFSRELPHSFGNMTAITLIYLGNNQLSGSIPKALNHCANLLGLDLFRNNFSGPIPSEILNLPSLSIFLDLSFNALTNSLPEEIASLKHLSALDLSNNRLTGVLPSSISGCTSLEQLHLEGNVFEGDIPHGLSALKGLQDLDLSRNQFSGLIPSFLGELPLERLNLSFNKLQGDVPTTGVFNNQSSISLEGNKDLCGGIPELKHSLCPFPSSTKKNVPIWLKAFIPIGVVFSLSLVIFLYKYKKSKKDLPSSPTFRAPEFLKLSYADLLKATDGFSQANLVGEGRFGSVYKGVLDDGYTMIAVKVLNILVQGASRTFMKECNALAHIRHRNLLKILTVCEGIDFRGSDFKALVYEFKENGSLEIWLHHNTKSVERSDGNFSTLDIIQRLNIAIDVAHALEYLHSGIESVIVHGDLKPANILLDREMKACIGDFGLANVISSTNPTRENSSSIGVKGTVGYVPPEYGTHNAVSKEGDVYSYGILVLEIFTNRRPTDKLFEDQLNIHNYVIDALPNCIEEIVDPHVWIGQDLNGQKVKDSIASVLSIGVICSKENPKDRMSMTEVVRELHKIRECYLASYLRI